MKQIFYLFIVLALLTGCNSDNPKEPSEEKLNIKEGVKVVGVILEMADDGEVSGLERDTKISDRVYLYEADQPGYIATTDIKADNTFEFWGLDKSKDYRVMLEAEIFDTATNKKLEDVDGVVVFEKPSSSVDTLQVLLADGGGSKTNDVFVEIVTLQSAAATNGRVSISHFAGKTFGNKITNGKGKISNGLYRRWFKRESHHLTVTSDDEAVKPHTVSFKSFGLSNKSRTIVKVKM